MATIRKKVHVSQDAIARRKLREMIAVNIPELKGKEDTAAVDVLDKMDSRAVLEQGWREKGAKVLKHNKDLQIFVDLLVKLARKKYGTDKPTLPQMLEPVPTYSEYSGSVLEDGALGVTTHIDNAYIDREFHDAQWLKWIDRKGRDKKIPVRSLYRYRIRALDNSQ